MIKNIKNFFFEFLKIKKTPFNKIGNKNIYLEIFENIKKKNYPEIDKFEKNFKRNINISWLNELALHTQVVIKKSSINYQHGRVLYSTLSNYLEKNKNLKDINIFESGTARGFSSICMSKALIDSNAKGLIHTIDIISNTDKIYWNIIDDHIVGKTTRSELLKPWKEEIKNIYFYEMKSSEFCEKIDLKRINFAFLDAVHDEKNISLEFNYVKNRQMKDDIIIFDDFDDQYNSLKEYTLREVPIYYNFKVLESEKNRHYLIAFKK